MRIHQHTKVFVFVKTAVTRLDASFYFGHPVCNAAYVHWIFEQLSVHVYTLVAFYTQMKKLDRFCVLWLLTISMIISTFSVLCTYTETRSFAGQFVIPLAN